MFTENEDGRTPAFEVEKQSHLFEFHVVTSLFLKSGWMRGAIGICVAFE